MPEPNAQAGTSLADLLDRVVDTGAAVNADAVISLAGVDLIQLNLRLLLIGVQSAAELTESGSKP